MMKIPLITDCEFDHTVLHDDGMQLVHIKNFISHDEIQSIINHTQTLDRERATVVCSKTGGARPDPRRLSDQYINPDGKWATNTLMDIDKRMNKLVNWKSHLSSDWAFVEYTKSGKYLPHFDYFEEDVLSERSQRVGSFIIYIKKASVGGATVFPNIMKKVDAQPGDAIFFNYTPYITKESLHGGGVVKDGTKLIAVRWFHEDIDQPTQTG